MTPLQKHIMENLLEFGPSLADKLPFKCSHQKKRIALKHLEKNGWVKSYSCGTPSTNGVPLLKYEARRDLSGNYINEGKIIKLGILTIFPKRYAEGYGWEDDLVYL